LRDSHRCPPVQNLSPRRLGLRPLKAVLVSVFHSYRSTTSGLRNCERRRRFSTESTGHSTKPSELRPATKSSTRPVQRHHVGSRGLSVGSDLPRGGGSPRGWSPGCGVRWTTTASRRRSSTRSRRSVVIVRTLTHEDPAVQYWTVFRTSTGVVNSRRSW